MALSSASDEFSWSYIHSSLASSSLVRAAESILSPCFLRGAPLISNTKDSNAFLAASCSLSSPSAARMATSLARPAVTSSGERPKVPSRLSRDAGLTRSVCVYTCKIYK